MLSARRKGCDEQALRYYYRDDECQVSMATSGGSAPGHGCAGGGIKGIPAVATATPSDDDSLLTAAAATAASSDAGGSHDAVAANAARSDAGGSQDAATAEGTA